MNDGSLAATFAPYDTRRGAGRPTEKAWEDALIVFDTSALGMLYRAGPNTRVTALENMEAVADQLWMPYQVGVEYHRRRLTFRESASSELYKRLGKMDRALAQIQNEVSGAQEGYSDLGIEDDLKTFSESFQRMSDAMRERVKNDDRPAIDDQIYEALTKTYSSTMIGLKPSHKVRKKWIRRAEHRIEAKLPPGWRDDEKPGDHKYGDYFVWFQILEQAKKKPRNVIFVTEDMKDDWWGEEGLHTLLLEEFRRKIGKSAAAVQLGDFIDATNKLVSTRTADEKLRADAAVVELRTFSQQDEQRVADAAMAVLREADAYAALVNSQLLAYSRHFGIALDQSDYPEKAFRIARDVAKIAQLGKDELERLDTGSDDD